MQQKVQFATALIHEPELVILDEPWSGLDPINAEVLREVVEEIRAGGPHRAVLDPPAWSRPRRSATTSASSRAARRCSTASSRDIKRAASRRGHRRARLRRRRADASARDAVLADKALVAEQRRAAPQATSPTARSSSPTASRRSSCSRRWSPPASALRRFEVVVPTLHQIFVDEVGADAAVAERRAGGGMTVMRDSIRDREARVPRARAHASGSSR